MNAAPVTTTTTSASRLCPSIGRSIALGHGQHGQHQDGADAGADRSLGQRHVACIEHGEQRG
jgi:hypothetical protein